MATTGTKTDAAPAAVPLVGKKYMNKLGGMVNDAASAGVSAFARRQMEKMGWTDGKGLGKEEQGIVSHVKVKKREEFMGVGVEKVKVEETKSQWWYNAYDKIAHKIQIDASSDEEGDENDTEAAAKKAKKKAKKELKKKRKREEAAAEDGGAEKKFRIPTDEELFKATGGKLFGRRAYGSCNGKLKRDELHVSGKLKKSKKEKKKKAEDTTSGDDAESEEDDAKKTKKSKKAKKQKSKKKEDDEE